MRAEKYNRKSLVASVFVGIVVTLFLFYCRLPIGLCAEEAYKIGAVFSVTGVASFLGEPEKKTAEMVVDQINASGGINGHRVELIVYDDESDATKATLAVKRLIKKDGVSVIIGPTRSGESLAVAPIAEKEQVPLISCAASYKIVTPVEERRWIFKTAPSDSHAVERIYEHMKSKGYKKIAILSVSTGFGASGREELLRYAEQYGLEIVADERYGPKDTDLTAQFTKVRSLEPDAIVNWSIGPTQILAVKTWRDLGMTSIPLYQSHGFGSRKNLELLGDAANGVFFPISAVVVGDLLPDSHPQKQVIMDYWNEYRRRYNEPVSSFGGHAWDAIQLAISALKAVGPDRAKIRDYLENLTGFVGQSGVFNFSPEDHNGLSKKDLVMVVVRDQEWVLAE
ncbi:ABC transporter substrate-binding protein [Thermodesulforhabdus norvegica]|uniref:Amino acid/amide ABC transporter substrate-binding protein, HAAT family n=1 Tax=Thermodesulforhabdus norvegica TaxID=39841 RepID=A0A1I4VRI4_9BACT|nr:ABC transporter substrate-binding protein [Thermodesulforhabdus norvegica]SFN03773.1 amino acid/amide ABC transporter substrate-binding protein, HAAT family [Thermodesulforhabdus norvegica]